MFLDRMSSSIIQMPHKIARKWIGTPFKHQGRGRRGIDCAGLVILVAKEIGIVNERFDRADYPRRPPHSESFTQYFDEYLYRVNRKPKIDDVVILKEPIFPCHCGIIGERDGQLTIIHSYAPRKKVVEEFLIHFEDRIMGVYEWPN